VVGKHVFVFPSVKKYAVFKLNTYLFIKIKPNHCQYRNMKHTPARDRFLNLTLLILTAITVSSSVATQAQPQPDADTQAQTRASNDSAILETAPPIQAWLKAANIPANLAGIAIAPAQGGTLLASLNANSALNPASVMKLYTTYSALELLGPAYTWKTQILSNGQLQNGTLTGDVFIKGSGDPSLKLQDVWRLLRELRLAGVQHIVGNWVFDRSVFADDPHSSYAFDGDGERPYNVQPDGLLMSFNATRLVFKPTTTAAGAAWTFVADPLPIGWRQSGTVAATGGACNDWRSRLTYSIKPNSTTGTVAGGTISVGGSIPFACGQQELYRAIAPAQAYASGLISTLWQELGGTHTGSFSTGVVPSNTAISAALPAPVAVAVLAQLDSEPLSTVIRDINKRSNNVMARMLYLNLGQTGGVLQDANKAASETKLRAWLAQAGLNDEVLVFDNGSGLSRHERSSAANLVKLLQYAYVNPMMPEFMSSLAVVSQDGTVAKRMGGVAGSAHLKTGTLKDSAALAGYVLGASGKRYVFAGIINHGDTGAARSVLDKIVVWLQKNG
jgi:D-alanyl-D-alanine carboxypeptidase/D-alanyl-D-alanine-endopeptidase (penicillin-binding protein 4)